MGPSFDEYIRLRRGEIDAALAVILPRPPECPGVVADAMRYSVMAGGKRLRPILCLASAEAVGADRSMAMPVACAIELIHTSSLVHEDLPAMDNDTMRRGRPTLHVVAGEGMAILAGDGLLTEAFAVMAAAPVGADGTVHMRQLRVIGIVARAVGASGMVGGQALDLTGNDRGRDDEAAATSVDQLAVISSKKTGALIRASAVAGAIMGGASDHDVAAIDDAAAQLGLAFQIIDDILDVEGVASTLGKTIGKDAAAGKPTYPAIYGLDAARRMAGECLEKAERSLRSARLTDSRLMDIGRWIVDRSN